jgi:hypothetical protein
LKLIDKTGGELQTQMQVVRIVSDDNHMEFGFDKREKFVLQRIKLVHSQNLIFHFNREIQEFKHGKKYKYLGTEESEGSQCQQIKERLNKE